MLFYVYDENTSSTVPVEVSDIPELSEQELEFIYDDKVYGKIIKFRICY